MSTKVAIVGCGKGILTATINNGFCKVVDSNITIKEDITTTIGLLEDINHEPNYKLIIDPMIIHNPKIRSKYKRSLKYR